MSNTLKYIVSEFQAYTEQKGKQSHTHTYTHMQCGFKCGFEMVCNYSTLKLTWQASKRNCYLLQLTRPFPYLVTLPEIPIALRSHCTIAMVTVSWMIPSILGTVKLTDTTNTAAFRISNTTQYISNQQGVPNKMLTQVELPIVDCQQTTSPIIIR